MFAGVGIRLLHLSYSHAARVWLDMEPALIHTWKCDVAVLTPSIATAPLPSLGVKDLTHSGLLILVVTNWSRHEVILGTI